MSATQYQIFIRYLNEVSGKPLTNKTKVEWISAEELVNLKTLYNTNESKYLTIKEKIKSGKLKESEMTSVEINLYNKCNKYLNIKERIEQKNKNITKEYVDIRPYDTLYNDTTGEKTREAKKMDKEKSQIVVDESNANNPKFDMLFIYNGISRIISEDIDLNPPPYGSSTKAEAPEIYYERMRRINLDPWFLHSTHGSLKSAMTKASELVNLLGKECIKISKIVPLDQYIDII